MKRILSLAILGSLSVDAACGKGRPGPADTAIKSDLALAVPQGARQPVSLADTSTRSVSARRRRPRRRLGRRRRRQATARKATRRDSASGGEVARAAAVIAAPAGVVDSATSKTKVKGGFDGAAMGAVLGARSATTSTGKSALAPRPTPRCSTRRLTVSRPRPYTCSAPRSTHLEGSWPRKNQYSWKGR